MKWIACVNTDSDLLFESPSQYVEKVLNTIYIYIHIYIYETQVT